MSSSNLFYAIIPSLLFLFIFYFIFVDKNKELFRKGLYAFLIGMILVAPAAMFEDVMLKNWIDTTKLDVFLSNVYVVGFIEEFLKLVVGFYTIRFLKDNKRTLNAFAFIFLCTGLGFSLMENIIYVHSGGPETALLRAFSSIPMHGSTAVIIGYFVYLESIKKLKLGSLLGLGLAMLLHGFYNLVAVEFNQGLLFYAIYVISFIYLVVTFFIFHKSNKKQKDIQNDSYTSLDE